MDEKNKRLAILLKIYLQSAAARVFEESNEVVRTTKRIEILQKCLHETGLIKFENFLFLRH